MPELTLTNGHVLLFDEEDSELISQHNWHAWRCRPTAPYYAATNVKLSNGKKTIKYLHRLLAGESGMEVDHRNGNGLDNRRSNLRISTRQQNAANIGLSKANKSGYKGVCWIKRRNSYKVTFQLKHLGYFKDAWEGAQAYNAAAIQTNGEFARLNTQIQINE